MKTLTIAIPTKCSINAVTFLSIERVIKGILDDYHIIFDILPGKSNIDQARSMLITRWYDNANENDLFMFLDSDQTFEPMDIKKLVDLINIKKADVSIGVYCNRADKPTSFPINREAFFRGEDDKILYAGTGVMMITKNILKKIEDYLAIEFNMESPRFWIDTNFRNVIPFFSQRFINTEVTDLNKRDWLGEDFGFCWLVRKVGGIIRGFMSQSIGHEVTTVKYFYPKELMQSKKWSELDIVYYLGNCPPWSPTDIETKGLGGSETAVVHLSSYWTKMGFKVTVYSNADDIVYKGVNYLHYKKFNILDNFTNIILWRTFGSVIIKDVKSKNIFIDLHDTTHNFSKLIKPYLNRINNIFVKSLYHKNLFIETLGSNISYDDKIIIIENGLDMNMMDDIKKNNIERNMKKLIYASDYQRGLLNMLKYGYDYIKKQIPDIEFHIYYGDELVRDEVFKKELYTILNEKGVINHGRISQPNLIKEKLSAGIHYYVGNFPEIDCISIKESLYCDCIPVVSNIEVFKERSDYLNIIDGNPSEEETQLNAAKLICDIIMNNNIPKLKQYPFKSWEDISIQWMNIISSYNIDINSIQENYDIINIVSNEILDISKLNFLKNILKKNELINSKVNNIHDINNKLYKLLSFCFNFNINSYKNNIILNDRHFDINTNKYDLNILKNGIHLYDDFIVIKNKSIINDINNSYNNLFRYLTFNNMTNIYLSPLYLLEKIFIIIDNDENNDDYYKPILENLKKYVDSNIINVFKKLDKNSIENLIKMNLRYSDNDYIDLINEFILYNNIINYKDFSRILVITNDKNNINKDFFSNCDFNMFWKNMSYLIDNKSKYIGINLNTKNFSITTDFRDNNNIFYANLNNINVLLSIVQDSNFNISKKEFNKYLGKIKQINLE